MIIYFENNNLLNYISNIYKYNTIKRYYNIIIKYFRERLNKVRLNISSNTNKRYVNIYIYIYNNHTLFI